MFTYYLEEEERQIEYDYYRTAWQTSLLMNATGNYRSRITPEKLLGKNFGKKRKQAEQRQLTQEEKERELKQLREKLGL